MTKISRASTWKERPEAGTAFALRFLMWIGTALNRRALRSLLYPTVLYFYFIRAPERRASRAFLQRVLQRPAREPEVLKHFLTFARVAADRLYVLAGRTEHFGIRFVGGRQLREVVDRGKPGIFLTAHFGSFEVSRVVGPDLGNINLRIVLDKKVNARFIDVMAKINPEMIDRIIDANEGASGIGLRIAESFRAGDWVGILGDRHRAGDHTTQCEFLGAPATFPLGPYMVAAALKAPIICLFCHVVDAGYEIHCEVLTDECRIPRRERATRLPALAQQFASMLEAHVRRTPYAWFNFFDFWSAASD